MKPSKIHATPATAVSTDQKKDALKLASCTITRIPVLNLILGRDSHLSKANVINALVKDLKPALKVLDIDEGILLDRTKQTTDIITRLATELKLKGLQTQLQLIEKTLAFIADNQSLIKN